MVGAAALPALGLDGTDLTFIRIDYQSRLQFEDTEIVIGTAFRLVATDTQQTLDPERREQLGPLLATYPGTIASASVGPDLTLRLTFQDGTVIEVPQDPHYESWHVVGPGTRLIVCPPAGDGTLALWQ